MREAQLGAGPRPVELGDLRRSQRRCSLDGIGGVRERRDVGERGRESEHRRGTGESNAVVRAPRETSDHEMFEAGRSAERLVHRPVEFVSGELGEQSLDVQRIAVAVLAHALGVPSIDVADMHRACECAHVVRNERLQCHARCQRCDGQAPHRVGDEPRTRRDDHEHVIVSEPFGREAQRSHRRFVGEVDVFRDHEQRPLNGRSPKHVEQQRADEQRVRWLGPRKGAEGVGKFVGRSEQLADETIGQAQLRPRRPSAAGHVGLADVVRPVGGRASSCRTRPGLRSGRRGRSPTALLGRRPAATRPRGRAQRTILPGRACPPHCRG